MAIAGIVPVGPSAARFAVHRLDFGTLSMERCVEEIILVEPFYIDDGELGDVTREEAFVLGYEFADVRWRILNKVAIDQPIHLENRVRLTFMLSHHGWYQRWDETANGWLQLLAGPVVLPGMV